MNASIRTSLVAVVLAVCATACGPSFSLHRPDDFLGSDRSEVASRGYAFRARNADGVVVAVREVPNRGEGSLGFWRSALRNQLTYGAGYAVVEEVDVTAASGQPGVRFVCGRDQSGISYAYWLTAFVDREHVYVIEAGGVREAFAQVESDVAQSLEGLRFD